jgi:hypothetical protein
VVVALALVQAGGVQQRARGLEERQHDPTRHQRLRQERRRWRARRPCGRQVGGEQLSTPAGGVRPRHVPAVTTSATVSMREALAGLRFFSTQGRVVRACVMRCICGRSGILRYLIPTYPPKFRLPTGGVDS